MILIQSRPLIKDHQIIHRKVFKIDYYVIAFKSHYVIILPLRNSLR